MSERSRFFQTYQDESTKFDVDMVENWRDGLDILLVFAALFSAVVTTFVVQTCQSLHVDYAQVTASLILRLIDVEVAISQGALTDELAQNKDPALSFKAQSVDLWVNGLWFTSLVLSLTTTLIAVLTKQWINEYMVLPSGTPRDRSRVRHFRLIGLEQWHVPLIIGLLPVIMHVALGVFFAGLIIFVCALSRTMAAALGSMTGLGALAYLVSNVLPLFYANCPYKTPLALYSFRLVSWVRRRIHAFRGVSSVTISRSLKDHERTAVLQEAENLDALSVCWLHNTSSSASVQSIALQSLGSLPLESIPIITGSNGIMAPSSTPQTCLAFDVVSEEEERPAVIQAIRVHHRYDQVVDRLERFQRAALHFGMFRMVNQQPNKYTLIYHEKPRRAIAMVCKSLKESQNTSDGNTFDVVFWGQVFEAALRPSLEFLNINPTHGDGPPSSPWGQILRSAVQAHDCVASSCKDTERALFSYALGPEKFPLTISRYNLEENGTTYLLSEALMTNMRPSFMRWVLHVGFPHVTRSPQNYTQHIPDDILVVLTLLQTPSVQATSSLCDTVESDRLFRKVLETVKEYMIARGPSSNHPDVDRAAICALQVLVTSESFGSSTLMTLADEALASECLFRGLNRRLGFFERDPSWLTVALFEKLWHVATASLETGATHNGWELVANIFAYVSHFATLSAHTETICAYLVCHNWLDDIGARFIRLANSVTPQNDKLPSFWCAGYVVIATTYVKVISMYANTSPVFTDAKVYLEDPHHLAAICKIFLVADAEKQQNLWDLAKRIRSDCWSECVEALSQLVACEGMKDAYDHVRGFAGWDIYGKRLLPYRSLQELPSLITTFARDQARDHFSPPIYADLEHQATESQSSPTRCSFYKRWRKLLRHEPLISNP